MPVLLGCIKWQQQQSAVPTSSFNPRQLTGGSSRRRASDDDARTQRSLPPFVPQTFDVNRNVLHSHFDPRQYRLFTFNSSGTPLLKVYTMSAVSNSILSPHPLIRPTPSYRQIIQEGFQTEPDPIKLWAAAQKGPRKWRNNQLKVELSQLLELQQR